LTLTFEAATATDLEAIRAVLSASDLPIEDVDQHIAHFLLAKWARTTIGTVALEYTGDAALLRSLCVLPERRGQSIGARLLSAIEEVAASRGVRELYLLTTSSAAFFEHHGFLTTSRFTAPPAIRSTLQFVELCPSTAICMRKFLPEFLPGRTN
jgi:amino-acid N-acetyltransferase